MRSPVPVRSSANKKGRQAAIIVLLLQASVVAQVHALHQAFYLPNQQKTNICHILIDKAAFSSSRALLDFVSLATLRRTATSRQGNVEF
jgi:hypothetical protein